MLGIRAVGQDASQTLFLPVQTAEARAHLDAWYARGIMTELALPQVPAGTDQFPVPPAIPAPSPRVGMLYWPAFGAQRFAFGTFLIDYYTLGQLRTALNGATVTPGTGPSTFAGDNRVILSYTDQDVEDPDAPEVPRDFTLFLVAARPLSQTVGTDPPPTDPPSEDDGYLITLVDQRYYWQFQAGTGGSGVPASWDSLFTILLNQLNAPSGTDDAVPSAYLTPSSKWDAGSVAGMPTGLLFDSAASSVGMRVVVNPDETVSIQDSGLAHKNDVAAFHATNISEFNHNAGGLIAAPECIRAVPEKVLVVFPGSGCASPGVKSKALNSFSWAPTDDYYGIAGVSGAQAVLWSDAGSGTADADQTALAAQYAQDWYTWQVVPLEATYSGFPTLPSSGFVGHYELHHTATEGFTRVTRPPVNYGQLFGAGNKCGSTVFKVRLTGQCITTDCGVDGGTGVWAADELQESGGSITVVGPLGGIPISGPGNPYCLYPTAAVNGTTGSPAVGDIYTAVPNPKNASTWLFTPKASSSSCGGRWFADMSTSAAIQIIQKGGQGRCGCMASDPDSEGLALYVPALGAWLRTKMGIACCGCGGLIFRILDSDAGTAQLELSSFHTACDGSGGLTAPIFTKELTLSCTGVDPDGVSFAEFFGRGTDVCLNEDLEGCDNTFVIKVRCFANPTPVCDCTWCGKCCSGATPWGWYATFGLDNFSDPNLDGMWVWDYGGDCVYNALCPNNSSSSAGSGAGFNSTLQVVQVGGEATWVWQVDHGGNIYQTQVDLWNCCAANTLSKISGDGPSTITLFPILVNGACPECERTWPDTLYVKVLDITYTGGASGPPSYPIGSVIPVTKVATGGPQWNSHDYGWNNSPSDSPVAVICNALDGPARFGCAGLATKMNGIQDDNWEVGGAVCLPFNPDPAVPCTLISCDCTGTLILGTTTDTCALAGGCGYGPTGSSITYEIQVTDFPP